MAHDLARPPSLYEADVLAWAEQQAALIRARNPGDNALDWDNIAEEIEDMGRNVQHACQSQLDNILTHLLKIEFVGPADTMPHWRGEIAGFRIELGRDLTKTIENRLRPDLAKHFDLALKRLATRGQIIDPQGVRASRPAYTWDQVVDEDWFPQPRYGGAQA